MKKIKILTIVLAIILVTMVAFFGVYVPLQNRMENKVKEYSYTMDLKGARNIRLKVDKSKKTIIKDSEGNKVENSEDLSDEEIAEKGYLKEETPYNSQEILNEENYQKSKDIIEKRLKQLNVEEYNIKLDENNGDIILEIPDNDSTDSIMSNIATVGKFEIIDSETKEVLMDNNDIKLANVMYGSDNTSTTSGTIVYLNIEFTKEGAKKLENISNTYVETVVENTEAAEETVEGEDTNNTEETSVTKEITMLIDDEEIMSTSFEEPVKTGKLQLSVGSSTTDSKILQGYIEQASSMASVLDTGNMSVKYTIDENQYILSDITNQELIIIGYMILGLALIGLIILVIRYKLFGVLSAISYVGLLSIFLLTIRYANVALSIQGILGIAIIMILNYIFLDRLLLKIKNEKLNKITLKEKIKDTYKEFFIKIIPICIAVIVFCFAGWAPISSFGMVIFWGILLIAIYNILVTNTLLKIKVSK